MTLTDIQAEIIKKALEDLFTAEEAMKRVTPKLASFGEHVPSLGGKVTKLFCDSINEINKNMQFAMSFVRVSTLQQIVKPERRMKNEITR